MTGRARISCENLPARFGVAVGYCPIAGSDIATVIPIVSVIGRLAYYRRNRKKVR
jgi:hypothetical protein